MSKCVLTEPSSIAKSWVACLDTETRRVEVSLWLVLPGEAEGVGDAIARESADGLDVAALLDGLSSKLGVLGAAPYMEEVASLFVAPLASPGDVA